MPFPRLKLLFGVAAAATVVTALPASAVPLLLASLTVDPINCNLPPTGDCFVVTAELAAIPGGQTGDTRGAFTCAVVAPTSARVTLSCTFLDTTAVVVNGLPAVAAGVATIDGNGTRDDKLCVSSTVQFTAPFVAFPYTYNYNKCFDVFQFGE